MLTRISWNFHRALSRRALRLEVASLVMSMPVTSLTLSWISPRIFIRWCAVVREFEHFGNPGGAVPRPGDITATSENTKNSESSET